MEMLKKGDLGGCSCVLQFDQNFVLYWLYHAPSACEFQSFALLDVVGRIKTSQSWSNQNRPLF